MISMILAINNKCFIGKDNKLMYRLKDDMIHFKTMTSGDTVVMGRKTFESLKGPLPNRTNIVITSNPSCITHPDVIAISPEDFKNSFLPQHSDPSCTTNVWIIGGGQVYETATPYASQIYCTFVDDDEEGDVKLPAGIFGAFVQLPVIKSVDVDEDNDKPYDIVHMVRRELINASNPVGEKLVSSTMPGFTFGEEYDEYIDKYKRNVGTWRQRSNTEGVTDDVNHKGVKCGEAIVYSAATSADKSQIKHD